MVASPLLGGRAKEVGELAGQGAGRGPPEVLGHHHDTSAPAQPHNGRPSACHFSGPSLTSSGGTPNQRAMLRLEA